MKVAFAVIHLEPLDLTVVLVYLVALIGLGMAVSFSRRHEDDKFLAGRSFGWFNVGLSIFGTNIGPAFLVASCSAAYATGMVTANFEWLAWLFLLLLAMVFAPHYLGMRVSTMPEFIGKRFGPRAAEFLSWYALLSTAVLWLGGSLYAGGVLLGQILDWPLWICLALLITIAASFTVAGGLAAVIVTDAFQSILMIVGAGTLALIGLHAVGGIPKLIESVPEGHWDLVRPAGDPDYPWPAVFLGYPVLGIWFWCTDQTIVQRVLGARDLRQGQFGAVFTGFLKILPPFIFMIPGICCLALHPDLNDSDAAFMTMVSTYLPAGMKGLIVAVLIAALISTIDSGLNSFSTIFTLEIYVKKLRPGASARRIRGIGAVVTLCAALLALGFALSMQAVDKNMFDLLQGIIAYFAPPMAAVFLVGVLWRRATSKAALLALYGGSALSLTIGLLDYLKQPYQGFWPHYLLMAFLLFAGICLFMVVVSLFTGREEQDGTPSVLREDYERERGGQKLIWGLWIVLALVMASLYALFD